MDENDPYIDCKENFLGLEKTQRYQEDGKDEEEQTDKEGVITGDKLEPYVGMEFARVDEAYHFYNTYGRNVGFGIRKSSQARSRVGLSSVKFVCNKEGFSKRQLDEKKKLESKLCLQKTPEREYGYSRTGCKAGLRIRLVNGVVWKVSIFDKEHNHELIGSPSKKRNIRSQKFLSLEDKEIILDLNSENVGSLQILGYLAKKNGGKKNITLKQKDVSNQIAMENRKLIGVDVKTTMEYFRKKQQEDLEFFFEVDADENGVMQQIFWVDGRARRTFLEIGDVVTFDTTYNTNKYKMPLAPFIGPNHHRQLIFYGMALIRSKKVRNFSKLFETWLKAMYGKHPIAVITDQDPAMRVAIKKIFPTTTHRCCQWYVMRKVREHLVKQYSSIDGFEKKLKAVINHSLTVSNFEDSWKMLIEKNRLVDHNHLNVMFKLAPEWVPAYFRGIFFADMSTTQRSESMNAMMKLWLSSHTSIYQFAQKIDDMIERIWHKESDEDIKSMNESPQLWSHYELEKQAREVYTRQNFRLFKDILKESTLGSVIEIEKGTLYCVAIKQNPLFKYWVPKSYVVEVDKENEMFSCNCKGFEFEGFLCQHAIKVMIHLEVEHLPKNYILKRWCKNANANAKKSVGKRSLELGQTESLRSFRKTSLQLVWKNLKDMACISPNAFAYVKSSILQLTEDVRPMVGVVPNQEDRISPESVSEECQEGSKNSALYIDPPISLCKGRKKRPGRFKPPVELNVRQRRTCNYCHAKEAHNIRTCPKRLRDLAKGKNKIEEEDQGSSNDEHSD